MSEQYSNAPTTTLNGNITNVATSLVVTSATGFPTAGNFRIIIDSEIMLVTAVSGTTFTVTRASESTTGASHTSGATVAHILTAGALDQVRIDLSGAGIVASRPAGAIKTGNLWLPTDGVHLSRDNGSSLDYFGSLYLMTPPVSGNFTWQDQGSATLSTIAGLMTLDCVSVNGDGIHAQVLALPGSGTAYTFTACIETLSFPTVGFEGGLCLTDGTKYIVFFWQGGRGGVRKYNSTSSFNSNYWFNGFTVIGGRMWYRIADAGGVSTNAVTFSISLDGFNYIQIGQRNRADFLTETKIGFYMNPNNAGTPPVAWHETVSLLSWAGP